jgi:hypothetical protein
MMNNRIMAPEKLTENANTSRPQTLLQQEQKNKKRAEELRKNLQRRKVMRTGGSVEEASE